jgi:hypothetical protein
MAPDADSSASADPPENSNDTAAKTGPMPDIPNAMNAPALFQRRDVRPGGHHQQGE